MYNRKLRHRPTNGMQLPTQIRSQLILNNAKPELWNKVEKKRTSSKQLMDHKKLISLLQRKSWWRLKHLQLHLIYSLLNWSLKLISKVFTDYIFKRNIYTVCSCLTKDQLIQDMSMIGSSVTSHPTHETQQ